ncbi:ABC transporter substrate-binding protein [Paenibacillus tarimensis]
MRKNRVWFGFIAFILIMSLIAGCAGGNSGTNTPAPGSNNGSTGSANQDNNTEDPKPKDPVTIKLHTHGTEANYNWAHTIAEFEKAFPDIKVELEVLSEKGDSHEALQKLDLLASSGETLDVLMFSDPASYAMRVGLGMVAPLNEFIERDGYNVEEEYKVNTIMNGQYYALPGKFNPWYVLLNKNHLAEANLPVPTDWTWDDFADYAKQLTTGEGTSKRYGTYFHGPQNGGWMEFLKLALASQAENTEFVKEDGTSNLDDPMFQRTLELRYQMEKTDQSSTPYSDMLSQKLHYRPQFFNQAASMILIGSWMNTELGGTEQFPLEFEVAVAPYPKNSASDAGGYTPVTTDFMAVAAKSKQKEEAYTFIRWYTTEGQIVQGKNIPSWNKVSDDDLVQIVDTILSGTLTPEKVDKESLIQTLRNSKSSKMIPPVTFQSEIYQALNEEYEKMILGSQSLDKTLEAMKERTQKIIDTNK